MTVDAFSTPSIFIHSYIIHIMLVPRPPKETAILIALEDLRDGRYPNATQAALANGANPRTVQRRVNGMPSLYERPVNGRALDPAQEQVLFEYIDRLDTIGMSPTNRMLRSSANTILQRCGDPTRVVGPDWVTRFRQRNNNILYKRTLKPLSSHRKDAHDLSSLTSHFERYRAVLIDLGMKRHDI